VLHEHLVAELTPIRTRAEALQGDAKRLEVALADGASRARAVAQETMSTVKDRMGLYGH
jgi:tryptophanyl-tRNA synthetase